MLPQVYPPHKGLIAVGSGVKLFVLKEVGGPTEGGHWCEGLIWVGAGDRSTDGLHTLPTVT